MRNFAFSLVACVASVFVAQSFAQTRDLFAEFEAEATQQSADSVKTIPSSSSAALVPVPSANLSSSAPVALSSPVAVSSSSVAPAAAPAVDTSSVSSSSAPVADSAIADSAKVDSAKVDSAKVDSAKIKEYVDAVNAAMERSRKQDSLAALSSSSSEQASSLSSSSMSRRDLLGPLKDRA